MNIIDQLIDKTIRTKNPTVVGLDPDLRKIPHCYKNIKKGENPLCDIANILFSFNKDIIDTICDKVPAVKPQIAFYEKYGSYGIFAFEQTVKYARQKGLIVIEDGKRNDIGNTAQAYAEGHLGFIETLHDELIPSINVDFLTVSPFLGSESIMPFIKVCKENNKGIFVLVKTSNSSSGEIQDVLNENGRTVSQEIATYLSEQAESYKGKYNYSSIGAVVGATYPYQATLLRRLMPACYFLVPGYGAQGGGAIDVLPCFNEDGLGAIVNSSRGILYSHMTEKEREDCTKEDYLESVYRAMVKMQNELYSALQTTYPHMVY